MDTVAQFFDITLAIFTLLSGLLVGLWAYTKYILERGLIPPVQFNVTCNKGGIDLKRNILEIKIHLKNVGSTTLVAQNIRLDVRYIQKGDVNLIPNDTKLFENHLFTDEKRAGRLCCPHSLIKLMEIDPSSLIPEKIKENKNKKKKASWIKNGYLKRGFLILEHDTFVQPGVDQNYAFVTSVPEDTLCILTWCSFQYAQRLYSWQKKIFNFSRRLGLIQFDLKHVQVPHTVESIFWIADKLRPESVENEKN